LGLVVVLARRYRNRGLPLLDLIEEGNIGLMAAIRKFDPEMGHRFSTYAKWWIRQSIELALMTQTRVVHVPVHFTRALKRRAKKTDAPEASEPRGGGAQQPTAQAGPRVLRDAAKFLLHDASGRADAAHESGRESEAVIETLPAPESEQPESHLQLLGQRRRLHEALALLSENERLVIQSRFGLGDDATRTLESIASQLKLSSERVRQIQAEAVLKLRRILLLKQSDGQDTLL
ncbi:MAG: sigma-70 family RNA polymerase sigma factor, partial [Steroidobacteraceae bacterium]